MRINSAYCVLTGGGVHVVYEDSAVHSCEVERDVGQLPQLVAFPCILSMSRGGGYGYTYIVHV